MLRQLFQPEIALLEAKYTQDRESFITQLKLIFDLLLLFPEKVEPDFGHDQYWPGFYLNRVLKR